MKMVRSEKWHKQDTTWALSLFELQLEQGCSFPINAGSGGLLSLLLITLLAYPVMYYSHRALAKMIYASNSADEGSQVQLESILEIKRVSFLTSYISVQFIQSY